MAKKKKASKGPDPIDTLLDIAGAVTLGAYVKHKVKKDYKNGCGEESAKAAAAVFGVGSLHRGSRGRINLGGLIGLNSALEEIERQEASMISHRSQYQTSSTERDSPHGHPAKPGIWREHCEDGSPYGLSPIDYETADDYYDALNRAKTNGVVVSEENSSAQLTEDDINLQCKKHLWQKYCEDGSPYGVYPKDYETADDYEEALNEAKKSQR